VTNHERKKALIDAEVWQNLISLEENGNPGILKEIIELYISAIPKVVEELKNASQKSDFKSLTEVAHSFKSSCNSVGALDLADELDKIEADAKKAAPALDRQLLEKVLTNIQLVATELESRRN